MIHNDNRYREVLQVVSADLKDRWIKGALKVDDFDVGFNAGLWNALIAIEEAAEEHGIDLAELGLGDLSDLSLGKRS